MPDHDDRRGETVCIDREYWDALVRDVRYAHEYARRGAAESARIQLAFVLDAMDRAY